MEIGFLAGRRRGEGRRNSLSARFFSFHSLRRRRAAPNGSRAFLEVYLREKSSAHEFSPALPSVCVCMCASVTHTELYTADKLIAVPVCTFVKLFHQPFAITNTRRESSLTREANQERRRFSAIIIIAGAIPLHYWQEFWLLWNAKVSISTSIYLRLRIN